MSLEKVLYLIILIEGYIVLAVELLAIRQIIPFVGNGIETIAIVVAAVLMPLALGYYAGGKYKPKTKGKYFFSVRTKLINNIITAAFILPLGLSYLVLQIFFPILDFAGATNRIVQTIIYSLLFIAYPTFLLGQTIPLVSNYFSQKKLSEIAGKMLFFSTTGSFLGSIISTLILMSLIGVNNTVIITISLMALLVLILNRKILSTYSALIFIPVIFIFLSNNNNVMQKHGIVGNNNYSTVEILKNNHFDINKERTLSVNRSRSSRYSPNSDRRFNFVKYVEDTFIPSKAKNKKSILIIGAGGFTIGLYDDYNEYTYIDIDKSLKQISEDFFLEKPLSKNKLFIAEPARSFLARNKQQYDFIFVDAYSNALSIPSDLITQEFFLQLKSSVKDGGIVALNIISSANFKDRFSVKLDNTLHLVFGNLNRYVIGNYRGFSDGTETRNVIYSYFNNAAESGIYTDDRNSSYLDKK